MTPQPERSVSFNGGDVFRPCFYIFPISSSGNGLKWAGSHNRCVVTYTASNAHSAPCPQLMPNEAVYEFLFGDKNIFNASTL
jgi:hypothetical protein